MTQQQLKIQQGILTTAHQEYEKQLKRYSMYKLKNRTLADDLVQDTFLRAWNYLIKGGKIETMKSFLYQILNHLIIDEYRRGHKTSSLDDLIDKGFEPRSEEFEHIVNILDGKATVQLIDQLPKRYNKVLSMRFVKQLSIDEIAALTKQSKNTIAVQIHRGLMKLKALYEEFGRKEEIESNFLKMGDMRELAVIN